MLADVRAGDFVIIQFGHNDSGALNEEPPGSTRHCARAARFRASATNPKEIDNVDHGQARDRLHIRLVPAEDDRATRARRARRRSCSRSPRPTAGRTARIPCAARNATGCGPGRPRRTRKRRVPRPHAHHRGSLPARGPGGGDGAVHRRLHAYQHHGRRANARDVVAGLLRRSSRCRSSDAVEGPAAPLRRSRSAEDSGLPEHSSPREADHRLQPAAPLRRDRSSDAVAGCRPRSARQSRCVCQFHAESCRRWVEHVRRGQGIELLSM